MEKVIVCICILVILAHLTACGIATADVTPQPTQQPDCAVETGTFPIVANGFADPAPTGIVMYKLWPCAHLAFLFLPPIAGVSNSDIFEEGPLPEFLQPKTIEYQENRLNGFDSDVEAPGSVEIKANDPTLRFEIIAPHNGWTPTGHKGVGLQVLTVFLD